MSHLPWNAPKRRTAQAAGSEDYDGNSIQRPSTAMNYFGLDGSGSSTASGGFTQVPGRSGHFRSGSVGYRASSAGEGTGGEIQGDRDRRTKVNQIVQNFFWKAAMVIVQSRMPVVAMLSPKTQEKKTNKWFNIELDEMETFREELKSWRLGDSFEPRPQPLIIETFLDTSELTHTQALVILDSDEKRWNVTETLETAANHVGLNVGLKRGTAKEQQIVLERWKVELSPPFDLPQNLELPVVYKKSIILFRALYSYVSLLPTWKFRRRLAKLKLHSALKIGCRVQSGEDFARSARRWDGLQVPLFPGKEPVTEEFALGKVESPAGTFSISVSYRKNCDFRVDDSEALLSSHFINLDEHYFRPSRHQRTSSQPANFAAAARGADHGSLPATTLPQRQEYNPTYGSLSSFHQTTGPAGASPLSALRAVANMTSRSSSNNSPAERPQTGGGVRSVQGSKSSLRSADIPPVSRRGSISFQPFKSPSLSSSPAISDHVFHASSLGRGSTDRAHRPRIGIGAASPSSYKSAHSTVVPSGEATAVQTPIPIAPDPTAQPMTRIASSFGSRRPRVSATASVSRADDDNSSGQASYSSSMAAPGSGLYTAARTSSYDEDLQIRDFMSMLADGQKTSLRSFGGASGESSSRVTRDPLSKFQRMKDSQSALADSMPSSLLLQPSNSPSSSSRNLSGVPGMVQSTTFSSSSSPGKPLSPHTPHTPAVPSRLSEGRTAQYGQQGHQRHHHPQSPPQVPASDNSGRGPHASEATAPLDIPLSPRFMGPRRANSMSQQQRDTVEGIGSIEFDPMTPFENHRQSISLGSADMAPLSMSRLLDLRNASNSALPGREAAEAESRQTNEREDDGLAFEKVRLDTTEEDAPRFTDRFHRGNAMTSSGSSYRGRFTRGRGETPPMGSAFSLDKNQSSVRPSIVGRRTPSWPRPGQEDEPEDLLFAMSDMMVAQQSRRSLDQDKTTGSDSPTSSGRRRSRGGSGVGEPGRGGGASGWLAG